MSSCKKNISNLHSSKKDSRRRDNPFDNLDPLKMTRLEKLLRWPQTTSNTNQQHRFSRSWRSKQWPIVNQRARLCLSLDLSSFHIYIFVFRVRRQFHIRLVLNVLQWYDTNGLISAFSGQQKKKKILRHDRSNQSSRPPAFLFLRWFIARVSLLLVSLYLLSRGLPSPLRSFFTSSLPSAPPYAAFPSLSPLYHLRSSFSSLVASLSTSYARASTSPLDRYSPKRKRRERKWPHEQEDKGSRGGALSAKGMAAVPLVASSSRATKRTRRKCYFDSQRAGWF